MTAEAKEANRANRRDKALMRAVAEVLRNKLARMDPATRHVAIPTREGGEHVTIPAPQVFNEVKPASVFNEVPVPSVTVEVDMTPVALALDRLTAALERRDEVLERLLRAVEERQPINFNPVVNVPETSITVEPPHVTFQAPPFKARSLRITHEDGTESTVTEE